MQSPDVGMTTKDWMLVLGPLIGVFLGGCITFFIQWFSLSYQRKLERERREEDGLAELLVAIVYLLDNTSEFTKKVMEAHHFGPSSQERILALTAAFQPVSQAISRIFALQRRFAPLLGFEMDRVHAQTSHLHTVAAEYLNQHPTETSDIMKAVDGLHQSWDEFRKAVEKQMSGIDRRQR